jgi:hypothetical protein
MTVEGTYKFAGKIKHRIFALFLLIVLSETIKTNHK